MEQQITKEAVIEVLKKIEDPELRIDIWTLGLMYDIAITGKEITLTMTLTSPMCPYGPELIHMVKQGVKNLGFNDPKVDITFNPPWEPSEEVRMLLGLM